VEAVEVVQNELVPDDRGGLRAVPTDDREVIPCNLVFRSIGYRGVGVPDVPFDEERGTIPNREGRVVENGQPLTGVYCAGWIKRGPTGVIGTNKKDATETVEQLLADARAGRLPNTSASPEAVLALLEERGAEVVAYGGWEAIDALEKERGEPHGRPRVKLCSWDELLEAARG
jgi:ferredoxin--NADP+ reductase